ncbi:hypothetical protein ACOMHN_065979 [Nucella lapillus]
MALDSMVRRQHNVFLSTFRRGVVYNRNLTQGIPCYTRPVIPWMHGPVMMMAFKEAHLVRHSLMFLTAQPTTEAAMSDRGMSLSLPHL